MRPRTYLVVIGALLLFTSLAVAGPRIFVPRMSPERGIVPEMIVPEKSDTMANGGACTQTAVLARGSCKDEVKSDYSLALGKCENISDAEERSDCRGEALEERGDAREECRDRHEARLEICEMLGEDRYDPEIDPAHFVDVIDNPFLPYVPGNRWVYEGETEDGLERIEVEVTDETREILGVECTVVRDRVWLDGELIEDTFDWYAQDIDGNVWYFGEISFELEDGEIASLEGSWESGVDGAHPGIVMAGIPAVGDVSRQEFLLREAEDMGETISLEASVSVEYGDFENCVQTREWTPIEPDVEELKYYAFGVGLVLEENPEEEVEIGLVEFTTN